MQFKFEVRRTDGVTAGLREEYWSERLRLWLESRQFGGASRFVSRGYLNVKNLWSVRSSAFLSLKKMASFTAVTGLLRKGVDCVYMKLNGGITGQEYLDIKVLYGLRQTNSAPML